MKKSIIKISKKEWEGLSKESSIQKEADLGGLIQGFFSGKGDRIENARISSIIEDSNEMVEIFDSLLKKTSAYYHKTQTQSSKTFYSLLYQSLTNMQKAWNDTVIKLGLAEEQPKTGKDIDVNKQREQAEAKKRQESGKQYVENVISQFTTPENVSNLLQFAPKAKQKQVFDYLTQTPKRNVPIAAFVNIEKIMKLAWMSQQPNQLQQQNQKQLQEIWKKIPDQNFGTMIEFLREKYPQTVEEFVQNYAKQNNIDISKIGHPKSKGKMPAVKTPSVKTPVQDATKVLKENPIPNVPATSPVVNKTQTDKARERAVQQILGSNESLNERLSNSLSKTKKS